MKSISTLPDSSRHLNVPLASFAAGLALAAAVFIGAGTLLEDGSTSESTSPLTRVALPHVGAIMSEPDFGSVAPDLSAFRQLPRSIGPVMPEPDFGSVAADYSTFARSAPPVVDPHFGTGAESVSAIEGDDQ